MQCKKCICLNGKQLWFGIFPVVCTVHLNPFSQNSVKWNTHLSGSNYCKSRNFHQALITPTSANEHGKGEINSQCNFYTVLMSLR